MLKKKETCRINLLFEVRFITSELHPYLGRAPSKRANKNCYTVHVEVKCLNDLKLVTFRESTADLVLVE